MPSEVRIPNIPRFLHYKVKCPTLHKCLGYTRDWGEEGAGGFDVDFLIDRYIRILSNESISGIHVMVSGV